MNVIELSLEQEILINGNLYFLQICLLAGLTRKKTGT